MTNGLSTAQAKVFSILINTALIILIGATSYLFVNQSRLAEQQAGMSEKFVMIDQYRLDTKKADDVVCRLEAKFDTFAHRIDGKLDRIIMQSRGN